MYTLLLTTHKHPEEAGVVLKEMAATTVGMSCELLVVGHEESDRPVGEGLPEYRWLVQNRHGCASSVWYGFHHALGDWVVWLCDDHQFPIRDWLFRAQIKRDEEPWLKVIKFNSGTRQRNCSPIGMAEKRWYMEHYSEPVFEHYAWDNEIQDWAIAEGVFAKARRVFILDTLHQRKVNWGMKKRDSARLESRKELINKSKKQYGQSNME